MAIVSKRELKKVIHPHYIINLLLASSYIILKTVPPICSLLFSNCNLDHRELEIMVYTAIIVIFRTRKQGLNTDTDENINCFTLLHIFCLGAVNLLPYLGTACMLAKMGNVVLYFYSEPVYGVIFIVCCLLHLLLLPEPSYQGPENVMYFKSIDLEEEIQKDKSITWLIELYAPWNPACIDFAAVFSELSASYTLENLKFGKVDLTRNPDIATKLKINISPFTKQLPTLLLFASGKEVLRRPIVVGGKVVPFSFTFENIVSTFDLNNIYKDCKEKKHLKGECNNKKSN